MWEDEKGIRVGDLVQWEAGAKMRVGVVTSINPDSTCSMNVQTPAGTISMRIRSRRLERIVSTTEPDTPSVEVVPTEIPTPPAMKTKPKRRKKATTRIRAKKTTKGKKAASKEKGAKKATAKKRRGRKKKGTKRVRSKKKAVKKRT